MNTDIWKHHEGARSSVRTRTEQSPLNEGGVEATIASTRFEERHHHRMVIKQWEILGAQDAAKAEKICRGRAEHAVSIYAVLRRLGLPVPTTYRLHDSKPEVLMTDLSGNGDRLILTPNNEVNFGDSAHGFQLSAVQLDSMLSQIQYIAQKAASVGIVIGADAYFITLPKEDLSALPVVRIADFGGCVHFDRPQRDDEHFEDDIYRMSLRKARRGCELFIEKYGPFSKDDAYRYLTTQDLPERERTVWSG